MVGMLGSRLTFVMVAQADLVALGGVICKVIRNKHNLIIKILLFCIIKCSYDYIFISW